MGRSQVKDPLQQFRFKVEIPGLSEVIGFTAVEGLESEIDVTEYREGGFKGTHKLPGIEKTGTVTFRRGAFKNNETYKLFRESLDSIDFRKDITVIEQDRMGNNIRQWVMGEAWASKFTGPSLDANSSEVSIEAVEVQCESIEVSTL